MAAGNLSRNLCDPGICIFAADLCEHIARIRGLKFAAAAPIDFEYGYNRRLEFIDLGKVVQEKGRPCVSPQVTN